MTAITTNIKNVNVDMIAETKENIGNLLYHSYVNNINKLATVGKLNDIINKKKDNVLRIMHWNVRYSPHRKKRKTN